jgi:hypothetical protein
MARRLQNGIYLVEIGPRGGERRNKLIFKLAREPDEITVLEQEARLYENQLRDLRGKFVPEYYGIFHGDVMGSRVAGMLLEYCIGSPNDKLDDEEKKCVLRLFGAGRVADRLITSRKIMLAACAVHSGMFVAGTVQSCVFMVPPFSGLATYQFARRTPLRHLQS